MEKLKVPNPTAADLGEAFGIAVDRMNEISTGLDEMIDKAKNGQMRLVYAVDIFNYIRNLCNTEEEYTWALHNHLLWLARTGRLFTTQELQSDAMKKYGKPKNL